MKPKKIEVFTLSREDRRKVRKALVERMREIEPGELEDDWFSVGNLDVNVWSENDKYRVTVYPTKNGATLTYQWVTLLEVQGEPQAVLDILKRVVV